MDANTLRRRTQDYWRRSGTAEQRITWYIEHLLPDELRYAEARQALEFHPCDVLALLVGYSLEPLLQSIGIFQPQRLVLLLNEWYGSQGDPQRQRGKSRGQEIRELIQDILSPLLDRPPAIIDVYEVADRPDAVFRAQCEHVLSDQQQGRNVIVDITGAKKSMDAGAFLFAAYADIPISYVDFDDYDEEKRRPFGFTCRIGTLANPYDVFRLRDWERVRRLYDRYHFRAAMEALSGILGVMRPPMFEAEHIEAASALLTALAFYEAWDDGDFGRAKEWLSSLKRRLPAFSPPIAVTLLGDVWPRAEGLSTATDAKQLQESHDRLRGYPHFFFTSNKLLITYAHDELSKISRLVEANEDNRSALLRAAGLDELLLKARLVRLWHMYGQGRIGIWKQNESFMGRGRSLSDRDLGKRLYYKLVEHSDTDNMRKALLQRTTYDLGADQQVLSYVRLDAQGTSYRARPMPGETPTMSDYALGCELTGETLTQLRNRAIHTYLYVTQPIAQAAYKVAQANLKDLEANWTEMSPAEAVPKISATDLERLPWDQLCDMCGLGFLPLMSQRKEEV